MTQPSQFAAQVPRTLSALNPVIEDLKGRPDAQAQAEAIRILSDYRGRLLAYQTSPSDSTASVIKADGAGPVIQTVSDQLDANAAMAKMGQLNTKRIIPPPTLTGYDTRLNVLHAALMTLISASTRLSVPPGVVFKNPPGVKPLGMPDFGNYKLFRIKAAPEDPDAAPGASAVTIFAPGKGK